MSFYYIRDVRSTLLPITLISWFVGIDVIEYPAGQRRIFLVLLYSSILYTIHITCAFFLYMEIKVVVWRVDSNLINVFYIAYYGSFVIIVGLVIIVSIIRNKERSRCITELENINEMMIEMGVIRSYKCFLVSQIWHFGTLCVMMILIGIATHLASISSNKIVEKLWNFLGIFHTHYPYFLLTVSDIMFCSFNEMITVCFEDLNALLESLRVKHLYDSHNILENNLVQVDAVIKDKLKREILYSVRKIYTRLTRVTKHWNQINAVVNLSSVVFSVWMLTLQIYSMYTVISLTSFSSLLNPHFIQFSLTAIFLIGKLFTIVRSAVSLTTEAHRTCGIALHLYPITSLRSEIRTFSVQLIENPLRLTLYGLCSLDYSMLQQIFIVVFTYAVMFIQNLGDPEINATEQ